MSFGWNIQVHEASGERCGEALVFAVRVARKPDIAVRVGYRSEVGNVDRDRVRERNFIIGLSGSESPDLSRCPTLVLAQDDFCETQGILNAHAAVAEGARLILEQE